MFVELLLSMCLDTNANTCKLQPILDADGSLASSVCLSRSGSSGLQAQVLAVRVMESYPGYTFHGWQCKMSKRKERNA
jgi:hypothetical protein